MSKKMTIIGFRGFVTTTLVGLLVACGGGSGGSSDDASSLTSELTSESIVARGVITQLGSIWVLGVEYETPKGRSYSHDDDVSDVASYEVGQWVRLRGRRNDDGVSGIADEVEYEAEIEGVADASGDINGVVIVHAANINAPGIPDPLDQGIRYEVSGIWLDNFTIEATYIKVDDDGDGEDEIKGFVTAVNPGVSLTVRGVIYNYGGPTVVAVGNFVEIHFNGTTANRVELEDDFNDDNDGQEAEYEGAVKMPPVNCPAGADFMIDMTCIDWGSVPVPSGWQDGLIGPGDMETGMRVEAEGHFNDAGLLIAKKIKGRGNRVRITANVDTGSISGETFTVFDTIIEVTTQSGLTEYENLAGFGSIDDTNGSESGLEIRGIRTGPMSMLALRIKNEGGSIAADKHELRAEVDVAGADSGASTITVMGVTSMADGGTELEIDDTPFVGSVASFLDMIDDDANGLRDVVDVDIDTTNNPYRADEIEIEEEDD